MLWKKNVNAVIAANVIVTSVSAVKKLIWGCLGFDVVVEAESAGGLLQ